MRDDPGQRSESSARHNQAQLAIESGELDRARALIEEADAIAPGDYTGRLILAAGFTKYSRRHEAEGEIAQARKRGFSSDPQQLTTALEHGAFGIYLYSQDDFSRYPEAQAQIRQALQLDPKLYSLNYPLYSMCVARGEVAGARAALQALRDSLRSKDPFAVVLHALDLELEGKLPEALKLLDGLPARTDIDAKSLDNLRWHRHAGRLCYLLRELDRAEEYLLLAVEESPRDCWSLGTLAAVYFTRMVAADGSEGAEASARDCAERAKECSPSIVWPHVVLVQLTLGDYAQVSSGPDPQRSSARQAARAALDGLREALGRLPAAPSPEAAALAPLESTLPRLAVLESKLLSLDADYPRTHEDPARAAELLESALQLDPANLQAMALLSECCWWAKDPARGLEVSQRGLERWDATDPSERRDPQWLGVLLAWNLGNAEQLRDAAAFESARDRLLSELDRGTQFGKSELVNSAEFLGTTIDALLDCALALRILQENDLRLAFLGTPDEANVREIIARIEARCR